MNTINAIKQDKIIRETLVIPSWSPESIWLSNGFAIRADNIKKVNLSDRRNNYPNQASGGEQQRAAIARALINKPSLIIADEPTGNLDSKTAISVVSLFNELVDEYDCSLILATHNLGIANLQDRLINIEDLIK